MVDREIVEEEVVTDRSDGTGRGLIIGLIVALVIAAILLVVFVAGDDDGGSGGGVDVELPEEVDIGVEGDGAEG